MGTIQLGVFGSQIHESIQTCFFFKVVLFSVSRPDFWITSRTYHCANTLCFPSYTSTRYIQDILMFFVTNYAFYMFYLYTLHAWFSRWQQCKIFKFDARQAGAFEQIPMVVCQRRAMVAVNFARNFCQKIQGQSLGNPPKKWVLSCGFCISHYAAVAPGDDSKYQSWRVMPDSKAD